MPKAVILDFDGTIADTIPAIAEGVNMTMEQYGFPTHTEEEVRTFINNGPRMLIRRALPKDRQEDEGLLDRVLADYDRLYQTVCHHTDRPYDGMAEVIKTLRARGYRIGVLSNKQDALVRVMCERVIPNLFDTVQGSLPDKPTKPDPYLTELVADTLGVSPADCVIVGDSDVDIRTAKMAGMTHIGVSWGYRSSEFLRENGARIVVSTPEELLSEIEKMN